MTLKTMQDKASGAMVAGLGTPWGASQGDANAGGYHLVWPRDLFKFANALFTAGDRATAARVTDYLFNTLQQRRDCGAAESTPPPGRLQPQRPLSAKRLGQRRAVLAGHPDGRAGHAHPAGLAPGAGGVFAAVAAHRWPPTTS